MIAGEALIAAHKAYTDKDFEGAITGAKDALELDPSAHKAYQIIALASRERGDWAGAQTAIESALSIAPRDAECLNTYGNILAVTNQKHEAVEAYKSALDIAKNYLQPAAALGQLYLQEKNPIQAADIFQNALAHNPDHPLLMRGLVYALKDAQQYELASKLLSKLPASEDLAIVSGQVAIARQQKPVAEQHFVRALAHAQSSVTAFRNLVQMRWTAEGTAEDGNVDSDEDGKTAAHNNAAELIHTFISDNPDAGVFYLTGAELLSEMGRNDEALKLVARATDKFGALAEIDNVEAKILVEAGQGEKAFSVASKTLQAMPGNLSVMAQYARSALMSGKADLALEASRAAQERQPNNQFWIAVEATALRALGRMNEYQRLYNYDLVQPFTLDPPPEYNDQADFLKKLKADLTARHTHKSFPLGQSLRGGTQTTTDLRFADSRVIQDFFQSLSTPIKAYTESFDDVLGDDKTHPVLRRRRGSHRLTGAWSVHLSGQGFHVNHVHPEGWISSAFYVEVPKDTAQREDKAGWIAFGKPPFSVLGVDGKRLNAEHMIAPNAGKLVLFPSYMWHGTVALPEGGSSRMTLPFDVVPA